MEVGQQQIYAGENVTRGGERYRFRQRTAAAIRRRWRLAAGAAWWCRTAMMRPPCARHAAMRATVAAVSSPRSACMWWVAISFTPDGQKGSGAHMQSGRGAADAALRQRRHKSGG